MCLFLVCVLFLFLVCVMCLCTLASLRSAGARFARCGRFAAAAAASRPQAITPNIIVFIVRGLTFVNVSALEYPLEFVYATFTASCSEDDLSFFNV